jgi:hypothetical protein
MMELKEAPLSVACVARAAASVHHPNPASVDHDVATDLLQRKPPSDVIELTCVYKIVSILCEDLLSIT